MQLVIKRLLTLFLILNSILLGQSINWKIYQTGNSNIPSNNITAITQDNSGNYWFGFGNDNSSNNGGLYKFNLMSWGKYDIDSIDFKDTQITDIKADSKNNIYVSTFGKGIVKITSNGQQIFNTENSDLPTDDIECIAIESADKIWFGTYWNGLLKYENDQWFNYTTQNSGLIFDEVNNIAIDSNNNKWIGTDGLGFVKYNDSTWSDFQCQNFGGLVPVFGLAISNDNNVWIITGGNKNRIGYIASEECFSYSETDIGFPFSPTYPFGLAIGSKNIKWIGTSSGLVKYDDSIWTLFNSDNSPLPGDAWINNLFADKSNNVWFVFSDTLENSSGLACFNENGITDVKETDIFLKEYSLCQNYPNPFNPTTRIEFTVPKDGKRETSKVILIVYDMLGREIRTLVNQMQNQGRYEVKFNARDLASGVYFYRLQVNDFVTSKKMMLIK